MAAEGFESGVLSELCAAYGLGTPTGAPVPVQGGLLHKTFCLRTAAGRYAVKLLNPEVMRRPTAMPNYVFSEKAARAARDGGVPALPAHLASGSPVAQIGSRHFMVFDWFEGKILPPGPAPLEQCRVMGGLLARIHRTDFSALNDGTDRFAHPTKTDWKTLAARGEHAHSPWAAPLKAHLADFAEWEERSACALLALNREMCVSHRDLGPKNVLWSEDGSPMTIDWEAAGYINPAQDLAETALYWAGQETGGVSRGSFKAFATAYFDGGGKLNAAPEEAFAAGLATRLEWLAYNLSRSLGDTGENPAECAHGTQQAMLTLKTTAEYAAGIAARSRWLL